MLRKILIYGVIAGLIIGSVLSALTVSMAEQPSFEYGMLIGYLTMLIGLSAIFIGIKRHRDLDLGGVIRFWPALGMGLAMSVIASVLYVVCWEAAVAVADVDFAQTWSQYMIDEQKAQGVSGPALEQFIAEMEAFKIQYANPWFRLPMTFTEIFPVGVLVSLISAALLRNSRFLPARTAVIRASANA